MKLFFAILTLIALSCSKDNSCHDCIAHDVPATVLWTGDVAVDGCDWCIQTDSAHLYHPDLLDSAFRYDSLAVSISFEITGEKFICGWGTQLPVIHVTEIKK